eukprot:scaffold75411_cov60-Phaeocystis_antarctica.AAC.2
MPNTWAWRGGRLAFLARGFFPPGRSRSPEKVVISVCSQAPGAGCCKLRVESVDESVTFDRILVTSRGRWQSHVAVGVQPVYKLQLNTLSLRPLCTKPTGGIP